MSQSAENDAHVHAWVRHQNVTSRGYAMPPYDACECGSARAVSLHHCPSCTCVLPHGETP